MPVRNKFDTHAEFTKALRDWFAGQALTGILSYHEEQSWQHFEYAIEAYRYADAMLIAREKKP